MFLAGITRWPSHLTTPRPSARTSHTISADATRYSEHFPARISAVSREASSAFGGTEVIKDALGVVRFPGFAGVAGGVVLVEADEQIGQLTADGLCAQQRGQLGKADQPVGVSAGPVVVGAVGNPEHAMVGLASLVEQPADLIGSACHLLPLRWRTRTVASRSSACHVYRPKTPTFTHIGGLPESGRRQCVGGPAGIPAAAWASSLRHAEQRQGSAGRR
jgi:hypothetical protein